FTPDDNGSYVVSVQATDKDGGTGSTTATLVVTNVAPTATFSAPASVNEGSTATVSFSGQSDPSGADTGAGLRYSYDFSNDGTLEITNSTSASGKVPGPYLDDGPGKRTVHGRINDKDGGFTNYTVSITVNNVAPTAAFAAPDSVTEGSTATVIFSSA